MGGGGGFESCSHWDSEYYILSGIWPQFILPTAVFTSGGCPVTPISRNAFSLPWKLWHGVGRAALCSKTSRFLLHIVTTAGEKSACWRSAAMAGYDARDTDEAPSLAEESSRREMEELLILLEEKDADLRRAAELGKYVWRKGDVISLHQNVSQEAESTQWMDARASAERESSHSGVQIERAFR